MRIGHIDTNERVLIVAEIGNNHEGHYDRAVELVRRAAECGVDAVKFQTLRADGLVSRANAERHARLRSFELSFDEFRRLQHLAGSLGLEFLSTPFDLPGAEFLNELVPAFKISSGDNTFFPLLDRVASFGKPILLSTGLTDLQLLRRSVEFLRERQAEFALLHCVCAYPVPWEQANLGVIATLRQEFGVTVGYSDHTLGIDAPVPAVALGARVIEKHFTLRKDASDFRDHQLSADPGEFAELVRRIRAAERLMGHGEKTVQPCEQPNVVPVRRSVVAARALAAGTILSLEDVTWVRPGGGIAPGQEHLLMGKRLRHDLADGAAMALSDVEDVP